MDFDKDEYEKLCNLIISLIKIKYPDLVIDVSISSFNLMEVTINKNSRLTILPQSKWNEIKRHIEVKLNQGWQNELCQLCCETLHKRVSCNKCSNYWCINCYINLFKSGSGIIICPYCRDSFGKKVPQNIIEYCIQEIKLKSGISI